MKSNAVQDQRSAVRFDTTLPVDIEGAAGATHNVSAHGIYFETDVEQRVGAFVNFTVEFQLYGRRQRLQCEGKVVRVEQHGHRIGVVARLVAPFFDGGEQVEVPPARS